MKLVGNILSEEKEQELLQLVKSETSKDAATSLFLQYSELIFGVCLKYLKNTQDAEDAHMNIYEEFLVKVKLHDIKHLKSWLYVLSKNYCFGILRKQKKEIEKIDQLTFVYSEESFHPNDEQMTEEQHKKLENCLKGLNDLQSSCIRTFYFEKMSYEEMAEKLNISWNKIRSYLQNGRRNLKNCMEN